MLKNISPWIHQLDAKREHTKLETDLETDVAIVGAGIAGISTAFFILKYTDKSVCLLERFKLAHGATGHNAGQVVSYFERGFASLVDEFGLEMAARGEKAIEDAWTLLDELYTDAELDISFSRFIGHAGLSSYEQIEWHLKNSLLRKKAGLSARKILVSDDATFIDAIPHDYDGLYTLVPHRDILELLETQHPGFIAVLSSPKGCINSALFCQEVARALQSKYPSRFAFYEHVPVHKIILRDSHALLDADTHTVSAKRVVLCTNGFESIHIINENGLAVDTKYHHLVTGKVGYMSGYLEKLNKPSTAISYYTDPLPGRENSYYYLTRRPYEYEKGSNHNLVSVGGPDVDTDENARYSHEDEYPDEMGERIDEFIRSIYDVEPNKEIEYVFTWHGLMGYTRNGVRLIGPEPKNPVLLYNLGCNGVGILPSIYGGKKISQNLLGENTDPSIFDVPLQ
jgi:glycine/D-amino acid oxidase-like deaminating enzyme